MSAGTALRAARRRVSGLSYRTKLTASLVIAGVGVLSAGSMAYALWVRMRQCPAARSRQATSTSSTG